MTHRRTTKWAGWKRVKPSTRERTIMKKKCGKKCFLGPNKSFPICNKGTCKVNKKGIWSAYIRAREWGSKKMRASKKHSKSFYNKIARKSRKLLKL
jgi:hypothetical protein